MIPHNRMNHTLPPASPQRRATPGDRADTSLGIHLNDAGDTMRLSLSSDDSSIDTFPPLRLQDAWKGQSSTRGSMVSIALFRKRTCGPGDAQRGLEGGTERRGVLRAAGVCCGWEGPHWETSDG